MTNKRMQDDLDRHVSEKFETWFKDSVDTYRRADCDHDRSMRNIAHISMIGSISAMMAIGCNNETMHEALDTILKQVKKRGMA